jgi:hypothetical protein
MRHVGVDGHYPAECEPGVQFQVGRGAAAKRHAAVVAGGLDQAFEFLAAWLAAHEALGAVGTVEG